ncbi:MAG: ecotin family protein [Paludibacteraceae bacterium]
MKLKTILIAIIPLIVFASCKTSKSVSEGKDAYTAEMKKMMDGYPDIFGFQRRAVFLSRLVPAEEKKLKIEIFPGRELIVDCNQYGLQGKMLKDTFKNGNSYYLFNTNGEIFSTKMACQDDARTQKFVIGESVMTDYRSDIPIVVYTSQYLQVKYSLWKVGDEKTFKMDGNGILATEEALLNLEKFPDKAGYIKHLLFLPELGGNEELNRKVEIIPGKNLFVDCNEHTMSGKIEPGQIDGPGFDYWIFNSTGDYSSTRKACFDQKMQEKFVSGNTKLLTYNSHLPIVVYTPKGFEVNYKIWETNGKMY